MKSLGANADGQEVLCRVGAVQPPAGDVGSMLGSIGYQYGYGSIPINTIFNGMNIHLPAILRFTRYQGFDPSPYGYHMGIIWWGTMWHRCESTNKKWGHPGCHRMFQAA